MCDKCSTKADAVVLHTSADCPAPSYIHDLPSYQDLEPDPARISGPQVKNRKSKQAGKAGKHTFPCKYIACPAHLNPRKALRSAATANQHMQLEHSPTEAEFEEMRYLDGTEPPPDPPPRKSRPRKSAAKHKKLPDDSCADDDDDSSADASASVVQEDEDLSPANAATEEATDDSGQEADEGAAEEADPDEEIDLPENAYIVREIVGHKLLHDGKSKYQVAWVGYTQFTWEPEANVSNQLRADFHQKQAQETKRADAAAAQRRTAAEVATRAQGLNVRSRRSAPSSMTTTQRTALVKTTALALIKNGMSYHLAYERADNTVPL